MRIFKNIFTILILILLLGTLIIHIFLDGTKPKYNGVLTIDGIKNEINIYYDDYGVPHIYAANEEDAYYALGYVYAQDRLFQTQFFKLIASGRLSEYLGKDVLEVDKFMRVLGLKKAGYASAEKFMSNTEEQYQKSFYSYLKGFNSFVKTGNLPVEYKILGLPREELTSGDIYSIINFIAYGFSMPVMQESVSSYIHTILGDHYLKDWYFGEKIDESKTFTEGDTSMIRSDIGFKNQIINKIEELNIRPWDASNSWVISPSKSKSGKVIIANDTHFAYTEPGAWYEAEISYPGYNFYGLYLPGVPFPVIGHNEKFGWGLTIFPVDNANYYSEKIDQDASKVLYKNSWVNLQLRDEIIKIKGESDLKFTIKETPHGPLVNDVEKKFINSGSVSLWWTLQKLQTTSIQALYKMSRASDINDFEKQLSLVDILGLYVNYGDADGNIAFWGCGKIPVYNKNINPFTLLDGKSGTMEIENYYPFDQNPKLLNPQKGFIATANNDPVLSGAKYYPGMYLPTNRIKIINQELNAREKWDVEDVKKLQLNQKSMRDFRLKNILCDEIEAEVFANKNSYLQKYFKLLKSWDGEYSRDAKAPLIWAKLMYFINKNTLKDELPQEIFDYLKKSYLLFSSIERLYSNIESPWWDNIKTKDKKESRKEIFVRSFKETLDTLLSEWGNNPEKWRWEDAHQLTFPHVFGQKKPLNYFFNIGPFKMPSCQGCINKMEYAIDNEKIHRIYGGPAMRNIIDFNEPKKAWGVLPTGQSGNIMSQHYKDQSFLFINGIYRHMIMADREIVKSKNKLVLKPKK
jgi:penicillin G amidase